MPTYLQRRMSEASTWAGLGALVPNIVGALVTRDPNAIIGVIAGLIAIVMPEKGASDAAHVGPVAK